MRLGRALGFVAAIAAAGTARATQVAVSAVLTQTPANVSYPMLPASGGSVAYALVITNTGTETIDALLITDTLPPQLVSVATDQPAVFTAGVAPGAPGTIYSWAATGLTMNIGDSYTFTMTGRVGDSCVPAVVSNTAFIIASGASTATAWHSNPAGFPLVFTVDAQASPLSPPTPAYGSVVSYTIAVKNTGSSTVTSLVLTDTIAPQISPAGATMSSGTGTWSLSVADLPGTGTRFVWSGSGLQLPPGGVVTFTFTGTVGPICVPFTVSNTARAEAADGCAFAESQSGLIAWSKDPGSLIPFTYYAGIPGDTWSVISWEAWANEQSIPINYWTVWRSIVSGSGFVWVGSVGVDPAGGDFDTRGYWDKGLVNGTPYYYRLGAVTGCATLYSNEITVTPQDATLLPLAGAFGTVYSESGDSYIRLKWSSNPYPGEKGVTEIRVWFSTTTTGPWLYAGQGPNTGSFLTFGDDLSTSLVVESFVNGATYWFMVMPGLPDRQPSFLSGVPYRPARGNAQPAIATNPSCPRGVRIAWEPAQWGTYTNTWTGQGLGYAVFRSDDGGSTLGRLRTAGGSDVIPYTDLSYLDCSVPTYGKRYLYLIRPVDARGNLGLAYPSALIDVVLPIIRTYPDRNRFRPGRGEAVNIVFQTTEPGTVRISIWTPGGELVRKLHEAEYTGNLTPDTPFNSRDRGLAPLIWDGTNDAGELVGSGAYLIVIEVNHKRDFRSVAVLR